MRWELGRTKLTIVLGAVVVAATLVTLRTREADAQQSTLLYLIQEHWELIHEIKNTARLGHFLDY